MEGDHPAPIRTAAHCRRFWLIVLPLMLLPLAVYAIGYAALRMVARIQILGTSSIVGPLRLLGRTWVTAAGLFRFYEPMIAWETRRNR